MYLELENNAFIDLKDVESIEVIGLRTVKINEKWNKKFQTTKQLQKIIKMINKVKYDG